MRIDRDWLFTQYITKERSVNSIAEEISVSNTTIYTYLTLYNIHKRDRIESLLIENVPDRDTRNKMHDIDWIYNQIVFENRTCYDISTELKVKYRTLYNWLKHNNIPLKRGIYKRTDQHKRKIGISSKQMWKNMSLDEKESRITELHSYDNRHDKTAESLRGRPLGEERKCKISLSIKKNWENDEFRKTHLCFVPVNHTPHTEEYKKQLSEDRRGSKNPAWRGGTSYNGYCSLFNKKFREHIRNKFNNTCYLCGVTGRTSEHKKNMFIHHIDYNKNSICKGKEWAFVPLCNNCHSKTNHNRHYYFNKLINYWVYNEEFILRGDNYFF